MIVLEMEQDVYMGIGLKNNEERKLELKDIDFV